MKINGVNEIAKSSEDFIVYEHMASTAADKVINEIQSIL